uniref:(northern house mosquito) hypothetical protein n=2 Tax=Culex pipiens TaxID=7175 RepID=A0A8D8FXR7_CULPI
MANGDGDPGGHLLGRQQRPGDTCPNNVTGRALPVTVWIPQCKVPQSDEREPAGQGQLGEGDHGFSELRRAERVRRAGSGNDGADVTATVRSSGQGGLRDGLPVEAVRAAGQPVEGEGPHLSDIQVSGTVGSAGGGQGDREGVFGVE